MATSDSSPSTSIEPLSHCNGAGVPYVRTPHVEQQIRASSVLGTDELIAHARIADRADPGYLQEETLAYLIRRAHRATHDELVNDLAAVLVERCTRFLRSLLRGLRADRLEEATAETIADIFERLVEPEGSDRGDFLQVRFWVVVKRFGLAAFRRAVAESERENLLLVIDATGAGAEDEDHLAVELADPLTFAPDTRLLTDEALARLEPHVRQALIMKLEGWPVEDRDPSVPTISKHLGKTSRTVRYWLQQAEEQLAAWRDEEEASA